MAVISSAHSGRPDPTLSALAPPRAARVVSSAALAGILAVLEIVLILGVVASALGLGAETTHTLGPDHPPPPRPMPAGAAVLRPLS